MNLFDLSLQFNGYPIKKAEKVLEDIQALNFYDFNNYVNNKKKEIVNYHLKHSTFYKTLCKNSDVSNWDALPVITKRDLQQPLEYRLSKNHSKKNVYINKTSGSSGDPFVFAKDKFTHALTWAIIKNRFGWFGLDLNKDKQARFYGIPLNKKGYYKERVKDTLGKRFRFSVFDLSDSALETFLNVFRNIKFDYINGYTSSIIQFAKYLKSNNVILNTVCPSLKACMVTSEMLFDDDKKLLETQFGVPIINEYGASELDLIAFENPDGVWILNNETLYIEILDDNDNVLPHGEEGRIVITSLYNIAHPFIRYDIGDIGIISKASTQKKQILEKLVGRTNDIVVLPSGKKAAGLTFYYITKSIIEDDSNVKEFVIEQLKLDTFKVLYASKVDISEEKINTIKKEMEHYLEEGLIILFERRDTIQRAQSGKLKQFSSFVDRVN